MAYATCSSKVLKFLDLVQLCHFHQNRMWIVLNLINKRDSENEDAIN